MAPGVVTNGEAAVIDQEPAAEDLDIQPPSEQLPAELLQVEISSFALSFLPKAEATDHKTAYRVSQT